MIAGVQQFISRGSTVASLLLLTLAISAAAANTPTTSVIHTQWDIEALAMSGSRIAYDVSGEYVQPSPKGCKNKVLVRRLGAGTTQRVSGKNTCSVDSSSGGNGVLELAFVGGRFAWIANEGGNTYSDDYLRTASLPRPREKQLAHANRSGSDPDARAGNWIGDLVGSGNLLAVNRWSTDAKGMVKRSELDLVGANGLRRMVLGAKAIFAQSADSGRIAVLRADGTVGIYDASGKPLMEVAPKSAREVALRGKDLLVLTKTRTLEIYDSRSGAYRRSWPVRAGAATLDAYAGLAAYADHPKFSGQRFRVHVLQLTTGKDVVVGTGTYEGRPRRDVELEAPGLVYAKNPHTLVFIPRGRLLAAVS
jgi:hypothetical protein